MIQSHIKRTLLALVLTVFALSGFAQEAAVATRSITPDEVIPSSIQNTNFSTNAFVVKWTYTEAGANNMVAFLEAHQNQKVRTVIGAFESPAAENALHIAPPDDAGYARWKESWLKRRTDKIVVSSEADAKKIMAGLKSEPTPARDAHK